jgi:non-canonical purine NTP pyrophosphatase, rdgB/HAM1 family
VKLILASNNKKKLRELREILSDMDVELLSQREAGCDFEVEETGTTFAENAYLKAKAVADATGLAAVADDSGLMVEALNGEPGVHTARYAPGGHDASDREKYEYLLSKLVNEEHRAAKFVSSICCIFPDGSIIRTEGECRGEILREPSGEGGFGYDPVFMPQGYDRSMAELGTEVKNRISHRANALRELKKKLRELNGTYK